MVTTGTAFGVTPSASRWCAVRNEARFSKGNGRDAGNGNGGHQIAAHDVMDSARYDDCMFALAQRCHVNVHSVRDKPLVVYEDHRFLLFVLWHAMHRAEARLPSPPLLITFDRHDDAKPPSTSAMGALRTLRQQATERDVLACTEWELSTLDDDWLLAAMELGVVGDVINVGAEETPNLDGFVTTHTDHLGQDHRIWQIPHLHSCLAYQGDLSDHARRNDLGSLWSALGWQPGSGFDSDPHDLPPIILDFDLDCFADDMSNHLMAWPPELMLQRLRKASTYDLTRGWSAQGFLDALEDRIKFRTVALESGFCGGLSQSSQILDVLDQALWDSELRERRFSS